MRCLFSLALLAYSSSVAYAAPIKFECYAAKTNVTHIIEIDDAKKQARLWARFSPTLTNGPFGPYSATITPDKITFVIDNSVGRAKSLSTHTINRKTQSLNIEIDHGPGEERWKQTSPCKPG
jgi:hypothetical protein